MKRTGSKVIMKHCRASCPYAGAHTRCEGCVAQDDRLSAFLRLLALVDVDDFMDFHGSKSVRPILDLLSVSRCYVGTTSPYAVLHNAIQIFDPHALSSWRLNWPDVVGDGSCANRQTALHANAQIHSALLLPAEAWTT